MPDLVWKEGQAHQDFISQLAQTQKRSKMMLVDRGFVTNFLSLSPTNVRELSRAISTADVFLLEIKNIPPMERRSEARFQELCETLGTMSTITTVVADARDAFFSSSYVKIISSLQPVKTMRVWSRAADEQAMQELAACLANHGRLKKLQLTIPMAFCGLLLPIIYTIASLTELTLSNPVKSGAKVIPAMASAVARLFRMGPTNPRLQVELNDWDFSILVSHNILCAAVGQTTIRGVGFVSCSFASPASLAEALTQSQLRQVKVTHFSFVEGSVVQFLDHLAQGISRMVQLEVLDCISFRLVDRVDEAVVRLTQAVAHCPRLRYLAISLRKYSEHADAALASCLSPENSRLVELTVWCDSLPSASRVTESPALLKALPTNHIIRSIRLLSYRRRVLDGDEEDSIDPWDPLLKRSIEMYPKLNCAGRTYVTQEAADKETGFRFLEAVGDDLDCLFYHLSRENPSLCHRFTWPGAALRPRGRKRRATSLA